MPFSLPFLDHSPGTPHPGTMQKTLLLGLFLALLGSSAVAACGGDEDTTPTPNEGTSGSGGSSAGSGGSSSGSSGSAGNAGQGGSAGDGGAAGSAGAGGSAGSGGTAGDSGTAGDAGSGGAAAGAGGSDAGAGGSDAGSGGAAAGSGGAAAGSGGAAAGSGGSDAGAGGSDAGSGGAAAGSGGSDAGSGGSAGSGGQAAPSYETDVKPILTQKCAPCHTSGSGSGGLNFNNYSDTQENTNVCAAATTKGECSLVRIQNGSMPQGKGCTGDPAKDAAKPGCLTADEQAKIQAWIDGGQQP